MITVKLTNKHEVLNWRMRPGREGEKPFIGKVLARLVGVGLSHKYATWSIASNDGEYFNAWTGHYFETFEDALDDFNKRRLP